MSSPPPILIGVDTGGTFTDLVMVAGRRIETTKTPSTPDDFARGVLAGLSELRERLRNPARARFTLVHSTTVATNALLEGKGARTGLVTTRGFRDLLELGRQDRAELYNLRVERPPPLVPRRLRLEVGERVSATGEVLETPSPADIDRVLDRLQRAGVESIAICLLFSFLHPGHERTLAASARARGFNVSVSSTILPEFREYERTSTTVINAFVAPVMKRYLGRIGRAARRLGAEHLRIVQSNGGSLSVRAAAAQPVHTLLSGPAAGLCGALSMVRGSALAPPCLITFDMGGTSTDVSLVEDEPTITTEAAIAGRPVRVPMLDIHTVGAGGGSIARLDAGGALHVGPESAGASPGPACYGYGTRPTVTDANLVLGRIAPEHFLGGRMALSVERARQAIDGLARDMGTDLRTAAEGILRIVNANMERAIRVISVERGFDPREFTLVCFGGAGGLHACELAESLQITRVMVPAHPGVLSAWGAACTDIIKDYSITVMRDLSAGSASPIKRGHDRLRHRAIRELSREGVAREDIETTASLDLRYRGQSYELTVPFHGDLATAVTTFHRLHQRRYGHASPGAALQVVTVRLRAVVATPHARLPRTRATASGTLRSKTLHRDSITPGQVVPGPTRVVEAFATTYIPAGWQARKDASGHLWITS